MARWAVLPQATTPSTDSMDWIPAVFVAFLGDRSPTADVGKLGGVFNVCGDIDGELGPVLALPAVSIVGFETV